MGKFGGEREEHMERGSVELWEGFREETGNHKVRNGWEEHTFIKPEKKTA